MKYVVMSIRHIWNHEQFNVLFDVIISYFIANLIASSVTWDFLAATIPGAGRNPAASVWRLCPGTHTHTFSTEDN